MKKIIASLIVTALSTIVLVAAVAYFVYHGIYIEINKPHTSFPSWAFFIPAGLFGIVLAPFVVCLINHFKSLKIIKANNNVVNRTAISPILVGYLLVCASIITVVVYLIFDGIFTQRISTYKVPSSLLAVLVIAHLLYVTPIVMMIILIHNKKKA